MTPVSSVSSSEFSSHSTCGGRTVTGCLSKILRRILCFTNLPLCSFDRFKVDEGECSVTSGATRATPGVVARLMGLETIPSVEKQSPFLGSADRFETPEREIPAYRELEDDKFFILSFERRHVSRSTRKAKSSRIRNSIEENYKKKKGRRESLQEDDDNKDNVNHGNLLLLLNDPCKKSDKATTEMGKKSCLEATTITFGSEGESENSSPNSVLEFVGFSADQECASPGGVSRLANSKTRRPLSEELESCRDSIATFSDDGLDLEGESVVKSRHERPNYSGKLGGIGRLAAMETMGSSDENMRKKQCLLEIGREVASTIFDHLLEDLLINL